MGRLAVAISSWRLLMHRHPTRAVLEVGAVLQACSAATPTKIAAASQAERLHEVAAPVRMPESVAAAHSVRAAVRHGG